MLVDDNGPLWSFLFLLLLLLLLLVMCVWRRRSTAVPSLGARKVASRLEVWLISAWPCDTRQHLWSMLLA